MKIASIGSLFVLSILFSSCLDNSNAVDSNAQFKADTTTISTYVKLFAPRSIKIPSGVWYEIDTTGNGNYPTFSDTVSFTYVGKLLTTEAVFEKNSTPVSFTLPTLIGGWQIGLPKFREGTYGKLYIPSGLGYGISGAGAVPANSNLIFEIKVTKVSGYQFKMDTTAISKYLTDNNIKDVLVDDSGIRYKITSLGTGGNISTTDKVTVTYSGKLMAPPNTVFANETTPIEFYLPGLINAWSILLPKIPVGSKFTMYVPSGLAYSIFSNVQNVPANSNLIFDVNVISTRH
jgi:FKBP-type peptidyl-prolyl cis-trans isomerase